MSQHSEKVRRGYQYECIECVRAEGLFQVMGKQISKSASQIRADEQ